jgi:hypothetical protein
MNKDMYEQLLSFSKSQFTSRTVANRGKRVGFKMSEEAIRKTAEANRGRKLSEETKKKISLAKKGYVASEETRKKMSIARKRRIVSDETRMKSSLRVRILVSIQTWLKISLVNKGHPPSEETRKKFSIAGKGRKHSEETKEKIRSKKFKAVKTPLGKFESIQAATQAHGLRDKDTISNRIKRGYDGYCYL